ncbi:MAG: hypothetical protein JWO06_2558 [Bacteroidota bacterium]|nr:hypothetical protein [Bacteroidota bacterium]
MKKRLLGFILLCAFVKGWAQQYDAQWAFAPDPSIVDFRNDTVVNHPVNGFFNIFLTAADICDSSGNLLCITNGITIFDNTGTMLINGDSLSPCAWSDLNNSGGLGMSQGALFIPAPGNSNLYYLFHMSDDTLNGGRPGTMYYTTIDVSSGYPQIVQKNVPFSKGIFTDGGFTACKHANGRDYWLIKSLHNNNRYFKFLLTPDTIFGPFSQYIGPFYNGPYDNMCSKFSQDGSEYATGALESVITLMDFDRCTGEFSNARTIYNTDLFDPNNPVSCATSLEFSPNGRFLYISCDISLTQYDLWNANLQDSVQVFLADSGDHARIDVVQLGPNGKLYGSTWNGGFYFMQVVNRPDEKGDSCNFVYAGYTTLTVNDMTLTNMINYKLGPLVGSGCDTLNTGLQQQVPEHTMRVMPNPADKYVYAEMGAQGNYEMQLLNEAGQLLAVKRTRQVDIFDTEKLSSGVYFIKATAKAMPLETISRKIVVAH